MANRIMKRVVDLHPEFAYGKGIEGLSVVRHAVGLRPYREGGVRLERESVDVGDGRKRWCVHNYGHAGYGYQVSYACAGDVVKLVEKLVDEKRSEGAKI
jgi:D-amino-acid oxidase